MNSTGTTETTPQAAPRKRSGCLTAFLVLMLITNPIVSLYYFIAGSTVIKNIPNIPGWVIPVYGLLGIANIVFAIAIWRWKKWGMYGFAISAAGAFVINTISAGVFVALFGLIGVVLLVFLVRPVWNQME